MKPYSFYLRKINEARKGLTKAIPNGDKREIRRWANLLEANAKQLKEIITEQIQDEGKLEQGALFATATTGRTKSKKGESRPEGREENY